MVKRIVACAAVAAMVAGSAGVFAQVAPLTSEEQLQARQRLATMEAILATAVSNGADSVIFKVRNVMGGDQPILLGAPRVRGFRLDGYGVFFDVEVPDLRLPILWPVRHLVEDARGANAMLAEIRLFAAQLRDPQSRMEAQALIARLQAQVPPESPADRLRSPVSAASLVSESAARPAVATAPAAPSIEDPVEEYRKQVKAALVNAMLENSGALTIGPDERLTVAARRNVTRDPLFPGDTVDTTTWIASIKGSDLATLRAQRMTVAEARKLVDEREQ